MSLKVIFDSNFLLIPAKFHIDIFEDSARLLNKRFEPILLSTVHQELINMAERGFPGRRRQALVALKLAEKCKLVHVERNMEEANDDVILRTAVSWRSPVATNDKELRRRLRTQAIPVIYLRSRNRLELEGGIIG